MAATLGQTVGYTVGNAASVALAPVRSIARNYLMIQHSGPAGDPDVIIAFGTSNAASASNPPNGFRLSQGQSIELTPALARYEFDPVRLGYMNADVAAIAVSGSTTVTVYEV